MAQLGQFALALAWVVTAYSIVASLLGIRLKHDNLIASGRNAAIGTFACITTAMVCLGYLFAVSDFSIKYIAAHSNRDLPMYFKVSSIWGGQEGSLLFWGWLLTLYSALVIIQNWRKHSAMMPYVVAVLMATSFFFTSMHLFIVNPFNQTVFLQAGASPLPFVPHDGQGLNPLLQDAYMVIHPPMLYLGFVGFAVPFAFAMAAMITKQLGDTWIRTTRRWTMVAWMFLSIGILLGGKWAYHELGWGGFWAWDPVENASMMPWLIGTAFLHSVMVQEKKGMLKVWNMVLIILTFIMSVFGTLLTRSGMVQSVHAFAQSPVGGYFRAFIIVALSGALYLLFDRLPYLKSENQMESIVSRESSFMFNNLILLAACFAVFWGTMFPIISEAATGSKITVGPPFFNKVNVPIAIFLMLLTGVGPLLAWRRASTNSLKRNFLWPAVIALASGVVLYFRGVQHFYALLSIVMSVFVTATIVREFYKGASARSSGTGETFLEAVVNLTLRNTRRYGGYIVHFGFVLLFIGWSGQAFTTDAEGEMGIGDTLPIREYTLRVDKLGIEDTPNYASDKATLSLFEYGKKVANLYPEKRLYKAGQEQQPTTEVSIYSTAKNDVYVVFQGGTRDGKKAIIQVFYNPLTMWVWIGGIVLVAGTLIALLPNKKTILRRRPEAESKEERKEIEEKIS
ncbi:MAG: cytochrome C biogenesis protein [Acidobacteria bacterium]|nr:MAG: cytochrome C biogenesis protein [Acidobacteriota bacterium]